MNAPKRVLVLGSVALGGAALIGWGWIRHGTHDYLPGLLANLGTALLLGVLFIVLQQIITRRIDDVRTNTRDLQTGLGQVQRDLARTSERLDELTGATLSRIQSAHAELADEIGGLATDVSFRRVFGLLSRGEDLQAFSRRGVRVRHTDYRLRWQNRHIVPRGEQENEPIIQLVLEDRSGTPLDVVVAWPQDQQFSERWPIWLRT